MRFTGAFSITHIIIIKHKTEKERGMCWGGLCSGCICCRVCILLAAGGGGLEGEGAALAAPSPSNSLAFSLGEVGIHMGRIYGLVA